MSSLFYLFNFSTDFHRFSTKTPFWEHFLVCIIIDSLMIDTNTWNKCLLDIENEVSRANFSTWFKHTSLVKEDDGIIFIGVPNEFVKEWLSNKYHSLILKSLVKAHDAVRGVDFIIVKHSEVNKVSDMKNRVESEVPTKELPLKDLYINKDDNLNPRYIFDTFIIGGFNELAYAASQAIVKKPGLVYNPFFIYGDTGLGKTHLIQAIGNEIKKLYPEKKVFYTTLERFSVDYINSVQNNKGNLFKEKYRKYDVLIMDDIQFISGKDKTQEELFHLFNELYENNKQIIFSSDKHPHFITGLEDRLKSRFAAGMTVNITEPEFESRVAILQAKAKEYGDLVDLDMINTIASSISGNIRELEGSFNTIMCQVELKKKALSQQEIKNLLKNNIKPKKNVSINDVVSIISEFYNLDDQSIYEKTRRKEIVKARQMIMFILREDFNISFPLIGQKLGGKDHTTVIHSCAKIKSDLGKDPLLVQELEQIRLLFK